MKKSKRAPKERLRMEKYQRLWPWLQREGGVRDLPVESGLVPEPAHYASYKAARSEATVHQVHKPATNNIFKENIFEEKFINNKAAPRRTPEDPRARFPVAELDSGSMNQHSRRAGFVNTTEC